MARQRPLNFGSPVREAVTPASSFKLKDRVRFGRGPWTPYAIPMLGTVEQIHHAGIVAVQWDDGTRNNYHETFLVIA